MALIKAANTVPGVVLRQSHPLADGGFGAGEQMLQRATGRDREDDADQTKDYGRRGTFFNGGGRIIQHSMRNV